jgi:hypothetical protein
MTIVNEQQQPPSPTVETLQQKIDEFANGIRGIQDIILDRKKTIIRQLHEIIQLGSDLNIDSIQLRKMILESVADIGVSESWLRKLLPETLKLTKHTRKDYLKLQHQRDQQPLQQQQQQQQQRELVESPTSSSSRHPVVEQLQQPSDNEEKTAAAKVITYDDDNHSIPVIPLLTQNENEGLVEKSSDDKNKIIEKLNEKIEELQQENTYLREQQQKQPVEKFTAVGYLEIQKNDIPVKVIVNVKAKSIEWMEIDRELIKKIMRMTSYEKTTP